MIDGSLTFEHIAELHVRINLVQRRLKQEFFLNFFVKFIKLCIARVVGSLLRKVLEVFVIFIYDILVSVILVFVIYAATIKSSKVIAVCFFIESFAVILFKALTI